MKQIEPIQIWQNGVTKNAVILYASVVSDNLIDSARLYYSLLDSDRNSLSEGTLLMEGADYEGFTSNEYAYNFIATSLNLVIIGNL